MESSNMENCFLTFLPFTYYLLPFYLLPFTYYLLPYYRSYLIHLNALMFINNAS